MTRTDRPLCAFIGYRWDDAPAAELLHEELALRGLTVLHDRCTFTVGTRLDTAMDDAVQRCDAYLPLLTPRSLYEDRPPDTPRPALDGEFIPICHRRRASAARGDTPPQPVIATVTHGLGDPHRDAPERVRRATGEDIGSLWSLALAQHDDGLRQDDAARIAAATLDALLPVGTGTELPAITIASRGTGEAPAFLTIDAVPLLGGATHQPGTPDNWQRFAAALSDVERTLSRWTPRRALTVDVKTHLTGAVAFGRIFHLPAGWALSIPNRAGLTHLTTTARSYTGTPHIAIDNHGSTGGPLVVDIDLIGHHIAAMVNDTIRTLPPASARIQITHDGRAHDLPPEIIVATADHLAAAIRTTTGRTHPSGIHLFLSTPATFAAALGQRLTALHTDIHLYERHSHHYTPSLTLPAATA